MVALGVCFEIVSRHFGMAACVTRYLMPVGRSSYMRVWALSGWLNSDQRFTADRGNRETE
jgi:hypothetical protein